MTGYVHGFASEQSWPMSSDSAVSDASIQPALHADQVDGTAHLRSKAPTRIKVVDHDPTGFGLRWFHGSISREETNRRLAGHPDGTFLIRESTNYPGDYTLCIANQGVVEHYRIFYKNFMLTCDKEGYFESLQLLVAVSVKHTWLSVGGGKLAAIYFQHYVKDADGLCHRLTCPLPSSDIPKTNNGALGESPWIIAKGELHLQEVIGHGEFGDVVAGSYRGTKVAIKVLKRGTEVIESLLQEASMMMTLKHDNLVRLLGVVFNEITDIYLVTEFMANGSLLDYLRSRGRQLVTQSQQLGFAKDTCSGMVYLEMKNLVHRDLAARNILLSDDMVAKVADFGLARSASELADAEELNSKFPIKWTAPESLRHNKFTCKSDVWSFGILLWEIYSFGRVPYPRIPVQDVVRHVEKGYRMEPPEGCPSEIADLMMRTWQINLDNRPTFSQILALLQRCGRRSTHEFGSPDRIVHVSHRGEHQVITPCQQVIVYSPFSDSRQGVVGTVFCTILRLIFRPATPLASQGCNFCLSRFLGDPSVETPLLNVHHLEYSTQTDNRRFKTLNSFLGYTDEIYSLKIYCKDFRVFTFDLHLSSECKTLVNCLLQYCFPTAIDRMPCFTVRPEIDTSQTVASGSMLNLRKASFDKAEDWICEMRRTATDATRWRVTNCSDKDRLINHYPSCYVIPAFLNTDVSVWSAGRAPFWCWTHPNRCVIVRTGQVEVDSEMAKRAWVELEDCIGESHRSRQLPVVVDVALKAKECSQSYQALRKLCSSDAPSTFWAVDAKWYSELEATGWPALVQRCLRTCLTVVDTVDQCKRSVILRNKTTEPIDATCLISSLAQICMDPFHRTIAGFDNLIRKEWIAFGHQFAATIHCVRDAGQRQEEMAPLFLLFLDCVFQLVKQNPGQFEFTEYFLIALWDLALSGLTLALSVNGSRDCGADSADLFDHWTQCYTSRYVLMFRDSIYAFHKGLLPLADVPAELAAVAQHNDLCLRPLAEAFAWVFWRSAYLRWTAPAQVADGGEVKTMMQLNEMVSEISAMLTGQSARTQDDRVDGGRRLLRRFHVEAWSSSWPEETGTSSAYPYRHDTLPMPDYVYILPVVPERLGAGRSAANAQHRHSAMPDLHSTTQWPPPPPR